jgi:Mn-dependent DtxR family transcriptional regulator
MGRPQHSQPLPPVEFIQQAFALRQDGRIVRRECHIAALAHEPATFVGPGGRLLARVYHEGRIRRIAAGRIAWALAAGQWPEGVVRARNGVDDDLRPSNLIETNRGQRPFDQSKGGKRSSLHERQAGDAALLRTLAEHQGALTVPQLSQSLGQSPPCCCIRLAKLERRGLVCGPHCNARRRWNLTAQGEALAASANPVVLDDRDRQVLAALALTSMGTVKLARRVEVCPPTIRRRVRLLVERGLVFADPRKFFRSRTLVLQRLGRNALRRGYA